MEVEITQSASASGFLKDRMLNASDLCTVLFCTSCGTRSSESDPCRGICRICCLPGTLRRLEQTRIVNNVQLALVVAGI
jgi:hypothetical protein